MPGSSKQRRLTLGLLGGIGSGKSFVGSIFREKGARVIDADEIVGQLLKTPSVKGSYVRAWGPGVLAKDGAIDPKAVARAVFGRPKEVRRLNRMIHPKVLREMRRRLVSARERVVVIDAPLLLETGLDSMCDALIFVDAPRARRLSRVRSTRGWTATELAKRESAQRPLSEKKKRSDFVVRNAGARAHVRRQTEILWKQLTANR